MSDNYSLIIKNGTCYIDGKLIKSDIGLYENKIKKIAQHLNVAIYIARSICELHALLLPSAT